MLNIYLHLTYVYMRGVNCGAFSLVVIFIARSQLRVEDLCAHLNCLSWMREKKKKDDKSEK